MPGYTQTDIANFALGHLGDRRIIDIDDVNDTNAEIIADFYDHAVETTFAASDWHWARREAELAQLPTPPITKYGYFYQLPPAFVRVSNVASDSDMRLPLDDEGEGWDIIEGKFATDAGFVFMHYVASNWDESVWPAHFAEAVGVKLAAAAGPRITNNAAVRAQLEDQFYKRTIPDARVVDSQLQRQRPRIIRSRWAQDRFYRGVRRVRPDIA